MKQVNSNQTLLHIQIETKKYKIRIFGSVVLKSKAEKKQKLGLDRYLIEDGFNLMLLLLWFR
jgi:hypothetical protein